VTPVDPDHLAAIRAGYADCFGCGLDNPIGLRVDEFDRDGDTVRARFRPRAHYRGFQDILHGGIVATALDEILAWTAILVAGTMAVTVRMEVRFRNPAPADGDYLLEGRLVDRRGRRLVLEAACRLDATDVTVAEAGALFLATDPIEA
jgi:acyl-coenzyme A thioesterase PaaI-like protein